MQRAMGRVMGMQMGRPMGRSKGIPLGRPRGRPMEIPRGRPMRRPIGIPMGRSMEILMGRPMRRPLQRPPWVVSWDVPHTPREKPHVTSHGTSPMDRACVMAYAAIIRIIGLERATTIPATQRR